MEPKWVGPSPFPNLGLPNLVATRQGVILLVNAGQWTADAGKTWHPVNNMPARAYYPKGFSSPTGDPRVRSRRQRRPLRRGGPDDCDGQF